MFINRPRRFKRRIYKEIQRGESVRPRDPRHCDSREAREKKMLKHVIAKSHPQISHMIAYLANYLHRKLQV